MMAVSGLLENSKGSESSSCSEDEPVSILREKWNRNRLRWIISLFYNSWDDLEVQHVPAPSTRNDPDNQGLRVGFGVLRAAWSTVAPSEPGSGPGSRTRAARSA